MSINFIDILNLNKNKKNGFFKNLFFVNFKFLLMLALFVFFIFFLYFIYFDHVQYQLVCSNLSNENSRLIISNLLKMKIPYNYSLVSKNLLVPSNKINQVQIMLLQEGLPKDDPIGFDLLNQEPFGINPLYSKIHYQRALEGELSQLIQKIDVIHSVKVHLSFPESSYFFEKKLFPSAAIILNLKSGKYISYMQYIAIINLISASVPNLFPKNIVILDNFGNFLNKNFKFNNDNYISYVYVLKNMEYNYYKKIEYLLKTIFSLKDFRLQVCVKKSRNSIFSYVVKNNILNYCYFNKNNCLFKLNYNIQDGYINSKNFLLLSLYNRFCDISFKNKNIIYNFRKSVILLINSYKHHDGKYVYLNKTKINKIKNIIKSVIGYSDVYNDSIDIIQIRFFSINTFHIICIFAKYIYFFIFFVILMVYYIFNKVFKFSIFCFIKKIYHFFKHKSDIDNFSNQKIQDNNILLKNVTYIFKKHPNLVVIIFRNWMSK